MTSLAGTPRRIVVVGGGASGVAAAIAARAFGARPTVVRRAFGATASSSGAVDLAGDPLERPGDPWAGRTPIADLYESQRRVEPSHPLATLSLGVERAERILTALVAELPLLTPRPLAQPPLVLATDLGTFKSTTLAQGSFEGGDLRSLDGARVGVVGIAGHAGADGSALAPYFEHFAARGGVRLEAVPVQADVLLDRSDRLLQNSDLAKTLEEEGPLTRLAQELARATKSERLSHLLLPPIMGLDRSTFILGALRDALGVPAFEMLSSSMPSVPGLRLQRALDGALSRLGIPLLADRVVGFEIESGVIRAAHLEHAGVLEGDAFVLATGKFIGGGLVCNERIEEPLLGLPVFVDDAGPSPARPFQFLSRTVEGPHALFRAGLRVDRRLRPLSDRGDRPVHSNLFASGSVLWGYDYIAGRSGLGTALLTGYAAGVFAQDGELP